MVKIYFFFLFILHKIIQKWTHSFKYEFDTKLTNLDKNLKFLLRENSDEAQQRFSKGCHVFQSFTVQFFHIQSWRSGIVPKFVVSFSSSFIVSAISTTPDQFFRFWNSNDQTSTSINSKVAFERVVIIFWSATSNFHLLIHVFQKVMNSFNYISS